MIHGRDELRAAPRHLARGHELEDERRKQDRHGAPGERRLQP
jgi:hypothetical protein